MGRQPFFRPVVPRSRTDLKSAATQPIGTEANGAQGVAFPVDGRRADRRRKLPCGPAPAKAALGAERWRGGLDGRGGSDDKDGRFVQLQPLVHAAEIIARRHPERSQHKEGDGAPGAAVAVDADGGSF